MTNILKNHKIAFLKTFLVLGVLIVCSLKSISQSTPPYISTLPIKIPQISNSVTDSVRIPIQIAKARAIDLEYAKLLKIENQGLKLDTSRYLFIISQKDSIISYHISQEELLDKIINNQTVELGLKDNQIKLSKKKTFWITVERDVAIAAAIFLGIKLIK